MLRLFFDRRLFYSLALAAVAFNGQTAFGQGLSAIQMRKVGQRIWQNECAGKIEGLTSWNKGEDFASLGIGHFIWYPRGGKGPFEESFPPLVSYLQKRDVVLPSWLINAHACPWSTRQAFEADAHSERQVQLRKILAATVREQTEFIMARLNHAVPQLISAGGKQVRHSYEALSQTPEGMFAMIDYINFKGDGMNARERYKGEGWGLAQVLADMRGTDTAAFAEAAKRVLARRVQNSPPARGEQRWLPGWSNRCDGYKRPL
ncbi:MAG: hypothetical protein JWO89_3439 [Verrucomicrobiaceae bacterium]|nr:hypothetical protein [Verrucomicrobiaceae bacterium]